MTGLPPPSQLPHPTHAEDLNLLLLSYHAILPPLKTLRVLLVTRTLLPGKPWVHCGSAPSPTP